MPKRTELLFISWQPHCSRSDSIASRLGGVSVMVYAGFFGSRYSTILMKYVWQSAATLLKLLKHRPKVVFVMTPPVAACLPVWLYCSLARAKLVIDAHSGAFIDSPWQRFTFLQRFYSRKADLTIVTSRYLKKLVDSWGAKSYIVSDVPLFMDEASTSAEKDGNGISSIPDQSSESVLHARHMTLVSSFAGDEPIDLFFAAAAQVPDLRFYVTGDYRLASKDLLDRKPENVRLTGFLPRRKYIKLLQSSDAVIALTTSDHTMQRGAYEGIYLARPVVTSNFPILREAFPKGTVHVSCDVASLVEGITTVRDDLLGYQEGAEELRREKLARWAQVACELASMVSLTPSPLPSRDECVMATRADDQ